MKLSYYLVLRSTKSKNMLLILFYLTAAPYLSFSQNSSGSDSLRYNLPQSTLFASSAVKFMAAPVLLGSYGLLTTGNKDIIVSSSDVYKFRQENFSAFHSRIDNYLPSAPIAAVYLLNLAGIKGKNNLINRSIIIGIATPLSDKVIHLLKSSTAIQRPDKSDFESFPSAHTAAAFVAAEFLHQEFKDKSIWYSIGGYATATAVGALRIMNNKHWMSDVFVGSAIGILTVKAFYLVYSWLLDKLCQSKNRVALIPSYSNYSKGLLLVYKL